MAPETKKPQPQSLQISSVIGFGGTVVRGLHVHPDGKHLIYPLGSTLIIRNLKDQNNNIFLQGHNGAITCVAVSKSGRYIASGQSTHMGFQADVCVWDFERKCLLNRMTLHKVRVQSLSFSHDESMLASVGGQDDNTLAVWDIQTGKPICGAEACTTITNSVRFFNTDNKMLVTAGEFVLRVWEIDYQNHKMNPIECNLGPLRRVFTSIVVDSTDDFMFCGTTSGEVMCIQLQGPKNLKYGGPKQKISLGVLTVQLTRDGHLVMGGGDGTIALLQKDTLNVVKRVKLMGGVTSVATNGGEIFAGTSESIIYKISNSFEPEILNTCHSQRINDICYPSGTSELFATCSVNDIRVWNARKCAELLRIQVPNLECNCVIFDPRGTSIISGWSDGKIRAFGPQTGKILFVVNDAHKLIGQSRISGVLVGVTALAMTRDSTRLVSGGSDGQVRVWKIGANSQVLEASMKEHKATINSVHISYDSKECISSSDDGSCIVWDMQKFVRRNIMYAQTYFKSAQYLNDDSQILTAGTDKKITYWDGTTCNAIRELDGDKADEKAINSLDISPDSMQFASGGDDKIVKMWDYDEGEIIRTGKGHAGSIKKVKWSPDQKFVTSVGDEGAIFVWKMG